MDPLLAARLQMAFTLGFHIILACLGVGMPALLLYAEWRFLRTGVKIWRQLARRWSRSFTVLFAVGAVSGTVLSFELGLLWPNFMQRWGAVIGLPFTLEGFAFFLEAIFAGIYLYGWDRLPPRIHWLTGWPIALSGIASAWFVVTANAWMNAPTGFKEVNGRLEEVDPIAAMLNEATPAQTAHMIVAAYTVTGFVVAAYYASRSWSGEQSLYVSRAMWLSLVLGAVSAPLQLPIGHWAAETVARTQQVKLAAMEGQFETERRAPLRIGGWPDSATETTPYALEIPGGLSWLAYGDRDAEVLGLEDVRRGDRPPVLIVHVAFQLMVGIGTFLCGLSLWIAMAWLRRKNLPSSRLFRSFVIASGPLSVIALEAGWVVTEVGRQPWIVQGHMRTHEAVTDAPGITVVFVATLGIYAILGIGCVLVLRSLARRPLAEEKHVG